MTDESIVYKLETLSRSEFSEFIETSLSCGLITVRQYIEFAGELYE